MDDIPDKIIYGDEIKIEKCGKRKPERPSFKDNAVNPSNDSSSPYSPIIVERATEVASQGQAANMLPAYFSQAEFMNISNKANHGLFKKDADGSEHKSMDHYALNEK